MSPWCTLAPALPAPISSKSSAYSNSVFYEVCVGEDEHHCVCVRVCVCVQGRVEKENK